MCGVIRLCAEKHDLDEDVRSIGVMISSENEKAQYEEHSTLRTSVGVAGESPVGTLRFPSPIQPRLAA